MLVFFIIGLLIPSRVVAPIHEMGHYLAAREGTAKIIAINKTHIIDPKPKQMWIGYFSEVLFLAILSWVFLLFLEGMKWSLAPAFLPWGLLHKEIFMAFLSSDFNDLPYKIMRKPFAEYYRLVAMIMWGCVGMLILGIGWTAIICLRNRRNNML